MNDCNLIGRLTKDPELRFAQGSGKAMCRFTLAVPRKYNKDETDFINCIAFGKTAEIISQYVTKGRQLGVHGEWRTGSYDAQDGTKRYTNDCMVTDFTFVGSSDSNNNGGSNSGANNNYSNNNNAGNSTGSYNTPFAGGGFDDDITPVDDGDMPF